MLKRTFLAIILIIAAMPVYAGEMDLMLRSVIRDFSSGRGASWSKAAMKSDGVILIPCIIRARDAELVAAEIARLGGRAQIIAGGIITAYIPPAAVSEIVAMDEVVFMEAAGLLHPKMDTARAASAVDALQDGSALGAAYSGKDVVVGVVDDGLDYGHPDFSDSAGNTRVLYLRQTVNGAPVECTRSSIRDASCGITDRGQGTYHGTHVTGIAAGNDSTYKGVASGADIMFVFNESADADSAGTFSTSILEGVSTIFEKADLLDKAAVVNLSVGTSIGAHDGTSLMEQGLSELVQGRPGRAIVNAAGNEQVVPADHPAARRDYVGGIHAGVSVADGQGKGYRIGIWEGAGVAATYIGGTMVDVWLDEGQGGRCSIAVLSYTNGRSGPDFTFPGLDSTDDAGLATGNVSFANDTTDAVTATGSGAEASIEIDAVDGRNGRAHAVVLLVPSAGRSGSVLANSWFDAVISASGGDCTGHMWLYFDYTPYHDFLKGIAGGAYDVAAGSNGPGYSLADGDSGYTATIPSTAVGVISAGSWMPDKPIGSGASRWTGDNGVTYDQSDISAPGGSGSVALDLSSFSSLGPTADGRTKPAVVSPGEPIISTKARGASVSSSRTVGEDHVKLEGTSMSSPHVAGIVALLFERNNTLTVDQVRAALQAGADTSGMTAKTSDAADSFGAGKVNASAALASVDEDTSSYSGTGDLDSSESGGGCVLVRDDGTRGRSRFAPVYMPLAFLLIVIALRPTFRFSWKLGLSSLAKGNTARHDRVYRRGVVSCRRHIQEDERQFVRI